MPYVNNRCGWCYSYIVSSSFKFDEIDRRLVFCSEECCLALLKNNNRMDELEKILLPKKYYELDDRTFELLEMD